MSDSLICSVCGEAHPADKIELSFKRPDVIANIPKSERTEERCKESDDLCALWGANTSEHRYFVRGVLSLPVQGRERTYNLGVWVEIPRYSFDRVFELWDSEDQSNEPAFSGALANAIPFHDITSGLKVNVRLTGPTTRPSFDVTDSAHALYQEQTNGITPHQAYAYTSLVA